MAPQTTADLGTLLGVFAHPDDEAYLAAGLMAAATDESRRVVCVTATRGEAGFPLDDPRSPAELGALRVAELDACLQVLGVTEHRFLGYADGGCAAVDDDEAADRVAAIIDEVRPDTILTFGPDGGTGHPDHIAACRWATLAVDRLSERRSDPPPATVQEPRLLYSTKDRGWVERVFGSTSTGDVVMVDDFEPETVDFDELAVYFRCEGAALERKLAALRAQASQVDPFLTALGESAYRQLIAEEFFRDRRPDDRAVTLPNARR